MIIFVYMLFTVLALLLISFFIPGFTSDLNISYYIAITAVFALSALIMLIRKHFPFFKTLSVYIAISLTLFIVGEGLLIYYSANDATTGNEKVIIVTGGGLFVESRLTSELEKRLDKAVEIYSENTALPIILSGGSGQDRTLPQAVAMKSYLEKQIKAQELDMPLIITEEQSSGLFENINHSLKKAGIRNAYIIVSRHNVPTAKIIKNKLCPDSTVVGAEYPISKYVIYYIRELWFATKAVLMTGF